MKPSFNQVRDRLFEVSDVEIIRETVLVDGKPVIKTITRDITVEKPAWAMCDENANNFLWWCEKNKSRFQGDLVQFSWRSIQRDLGKANFNSLKDALELLKKYEFINYAVDKKGFVVQRLWN